jgi:uncharacterized protein YhaN
MSILKTLPIMEIPFIRELAVEKTSTLQLDLAVQNACEEWQQALKEMDYIDGDLAEYVIYKINAAERRYIALLDQARRTGITAWPDMDFPPVQEMHEEGLCSTGVKNAPAL